MIMEPSEKLKPLLEKVRNYINDAIIPLDQEFIDETDNNGRWQHSPRQTEILDQLKQGAREQGLWNFFLTEGEHGSGLSTVDYAFIAEETGRSALASTAAHRIPAIWRCWQNTAARHKKIAG